MGKTDFKSNQSTKLKHVPVWLIQMYLQRICCLFFSHATLYSMLTIVILKYCTIDLSSFVSLQIYIRWYGNKKNQWWCTYNLSQLTSFKNIYIAMYVYVTWKSFIKIELLKQISHYQGIILLMITFSYILSEFNISCFIQNKEQMMMREMYSES